MPHPAGVEVKDNLWRYFRAQYATGAAVRGVVGGGHAAPQYPRGAAGGPDSAEGPAGMPALVHML